MPGVGLSHDIILPRSSFRVSDCGQVLEHFLAIQDPETS